MRHTVRRLTRETAIRLAGETRARSALERVRAARALVDPGLERARRDDHAMAVVLATVLRRDSCAIDVGANVGAILERIVELSPDGRHIAYEPIPRLHATLARRFPDVDVRCAALSDTAGESEFVHVVDTPSLSGLRLRSDLADAPERIERIRVRTERLDDVVDVAPTVLKVDVEGGELQVLRGSAETMARHRPVVMFEHGVGGADAYGSRPGEVFDVLTTAGLRIFDLDGSGPYSRMRFEDTFTAPVWNFLAAPA